MGQVYQWIATGIFLRGGKTLKISNVEVKDLVKQYGSPLVAYDESALRQRLHDYANYFQSDEFETSVLYASKAFSCKAMIRLIDEYGLYLDVVSAGELYTAKQAGYDCSKIFFHGNNKTQEELEMAIEYGVGTIVVDNIQEAKRLDALLEEKGASIHALLRVNPGIEAHTHEYIVTAHVDSKFGVAMAQEELMDETIAFLSESETIQFDGLHAHIGSQIFDKQAFVEEIKKLFAFVSELKAKGLTINTLNLGGGFAAKYVESDQPIPLNEVCSTILATAQECNKEVDGMIKRICIEPGRSIVAEAGYSIYTVGDTKQTPNKNYVFVDGGMADNIRPALYGAEYDCFIDGKEDQEANVKTTVAGKCCESGDILIQCIDLPQGQRGDLLVMKTTGAYGYSMASHYNKLLLPAVVFVKDGDSRIVIRRETFEDLIKLEE